MVAGEDDHGIFALTRALKCAEHATDVFVDEGDHAVVRCFVVLFAFAGRVASLPSKKAFESRVGLQVAFTKYRRWQVGGIVFVRVGRVKRPVWVKGVDAHEPGAVVGGFDKFDGAVRTPGGLVILGIHVGAIVAIRAVFFSLEDVAEVYALFGEPVGVLVAISDALIV